MNFTELRLKFRHFVRRNKKFIYILIIVWLSIFIIDKMMANMDVDYTPETTYEAHSSVMDSASKTPSAMQDPIEDLIKEYIGYCNEGNYQKAFNMLSEDCQNYSFDNDIEKFMAHVLIKMPTPKKYFVQDYSNTTYNKRKFYIYEVRYTNDLLASGLTNSTYGFTSEKFTFYRDTDNEIKMSTGDYIYHTDIKSISENEYLKIDVLDKLVNYSTEEYTVKFTNRSNFTVVIADNVEKDEILLTLPNETRTRTQLTNIVLDPNSSMDIKFVFPKFVDDGDISQSLVISSIRVMEKYTNPDFADEETIQSEIDNAISKFSMEVVVTE